jgi:integrase
VTLDGKQILLGTTKREADDEFHRLMVSRGEVSAADSRITVGEVVDLWLGDCARRLRDNTMDSYRIHAGSFAAECGRIPARLLRPLHVLEWLKGKELSESTRSLKMTIAKMAMQWAEDMGYIDKSWLRRLKCPEIGRRKAITLDEARAILETISPVGALALRLQLLTGMRPGEVCSLVGERIDLENHRAVVQGKRTRSNPTGLRTVFLSPEAAEMLRPLLAEHPTGPILWRKYHGPLTVSSLESAVEHARPRAAKLLDRNEESMGHVKPHCFRGLFSTEALRRGVDSALVSKLLGHSDPSILMRHYAEPDEAMMRDAARRATGHTSPPNGDTRRGPPE